MEDITEIKLERPVPDVAGPLLAKAFSLVFLSAERGLGRKSLESVRGSDGAREAADFRLCVW